MRTIINCSYYQSKVIIYVLEWTLAAGNLDNDWEILTNHQINFRNNKNSEFPPFGIL